MTRVPRLAVDSRTVSDALEDGDVAATVGAAGCGLLGSLRSRAADGGIDAARTARGEAASTEAGGVSVAAGAAATGAAGAAVAGAAGAATLALVSAAPALAQEVAPAETASGPVEDQPGSF